MISTAWMQKDEEMQRERNTNADPEITYNTHRVMVEMSNKPSNKFFCYAITFLYFKGGERKLKKKEKVKPDKNLQVHVSFLQLTGMH